MSRKKSREKLKSVVQKVLEDHGPILQSELKNRIAGTEDQNVKYANPYSSKQSLAVTLSQVREKWEETGFISTEEKIPDRGSLLTHEWKLNQD
jgi:hypothetical protein